MSINGTWIMSLFSFNSSYNYNQKLLYWAHIIFEWKIFEGYDDVLFLSDFFEDAAVREPIIFVWKERSIEIHLVSLCFSFYTNDAITLLNGYDRRRNYSYEILFSRCLYIYINVVEIKFCTEFSVVI